MDNKQSCIILHKMPLDCIDDEYILWEIDRYFICDSRINNVLNEFFEGYERPIKIFLTDQHVTHFVDGNNVRYDANFKPNQEFIEKMLVSLKDWYGGL